MQPLRSSATLLALFVGAFASLPASAAEALYNQISLRAEASQEVARDLMTVTLYTEAQNKDPSTLSTQITTTLNKALGQAREVKAVTLRQGNRNSYPIYDSKQQTITGWRERAELRLESENFAALSKLTGELLQDLKMGNMDFAISTKTRKASEDALLKEAVGAFKARAQLATEALGGKTYRIVNLSLNNNGYPRPYARGPMVMKASAPSAEVTPDIEPGTSEVSINADGVIEVQMP